MMGLRLVIRMIRVVSEGGHGLCILFCVLALEDSALRHGDTLIRGG